MMLSDVCCVQPWAQGSGDRLPLLSAVISPAAEHHRPLASTKLYCLVTDYLLSSVTKQYNLVLANGR